MAPFVNLGPLQIPTYFLILSLVCTAGVFILPKWAERYGQAEGMAARLYLLVLISGFFGARLFHVIFEAPEVYRDYPIEIFYIWQGGLVFLGGVLVALAASWFWLKKQGEDFLLWADLFSPWMAFGYAFGRVGCFFNGCCYGTECHLPWAVRFPSHRFAIEPFVARHPTQIYAFLSEMLIFAVLMVWLEKKRGHLEAFKNTGFVFCAWLFMHGLSRLILEQFRDDDRGAFYYGFSLSSLISLFLIGVGFWGFVLNKKRPLKEGA